MSVVFSSETKTPKSTRPATKIKYTPLEQQVLDVRGQYPDALLFVECGYKYRFFGEDAEVHTCKIHLMLFFSKI